MNCTCAINGLIDRRLHLITQQTARNSQQLTRTARLNKYIDLYIVYVLAYTNQLELRNVILCNVLQGLTTDLTTINLCTGSYSNTFSEYGNYEIRQST